MADTPVIPWRPDIPWRVGESVGRTIYRGPDSTDLCGMMDTPELAAQVVDALLGAQTFGIEVNRSDPVRVGDSGERVVFVTYRIPAD